MRRKKRKKWWAVVIVLCVIAAACVIYVKADQEKLKQSVPVSRSIPKIKRIEKISSITNQEAGVVLQQELVDFQNVSQYFTIQDIDENILERINGKSYQENENISLQDLRYVKVLHYNYDHEIQVGELIVNVQIAEDCKKIFEELFAIEYEIYSMYLVDHFWDGNGVDADTNSVENNNTSAFNYRVVPGSKSLSNHAKGLAIDVNPLQNPYVKYKSNGEFEKYYKDMEKYLDRDSGAAHMITHEDACYKIFAKYGFTWGGDWNSSKDYQHFQKVN